MIITSLITLSVPVSLLEPRKKFCYRSQVEGEISFYQAKIAVWKIEEDIFGAKGSAWRAYFAMIKCSIFTVTLPMCLHLWKWASLGHHQRIDHFVRFVHSFVCWRSCCTKTSCISLFEATLLRICDTNVAHEDVFLESTVKIISKCERWYQNNLRAC